MVLNFRSVKVYIYRKPIDMRKGHFGLSALVKNEMNQDFLSGNLFLFVSKNRKTAKVLFWDGTGLIVIHKKMERGRFMKFDKLNEVTELTTSEMSLILEGSQIRLPLSPAEYKLGNN